MQTTTRLTGRCAITTPTTKPVDKTLADFVPPDLQGQPSNEALFSVLLSKVAPDLAEELIIRQFAFMAAMNYHSTLMQSGMSTPPRPHTVRETAAHMEKYFGRVD